MLMINIQNINGYGIQDPGFELLREVAQRSLTPDPSPKGEGSRCTALTEEEPLDLSALITPLATGRGVGGEAIGVRPFGETELSSLHYEEADTLNSEQIKRDFPVLNQKVNGHDLVWLDNIAGRTPLLPVRRMPMRRLVKRCSGSSTPPPARKSSSCVAPPRVSTS